MRWYLFALICFLNLLSCKNESQVIESKLIGKWEVDAAMRDGAITETLKNAYFNFIDEETLISNVNRRETTYQYTFKDNIIHQTGPMNVDYKVEGMKDDTLILSATIRKYNFRFRLIKAAFPAPLK